MNRKAIVWLHGEEVGVLEETDAGYPFFDGLIPEGWLLDIAVDNWKVSERDRFGLLLTCCQNTIGAVSVMPFENEEL
jgi:hypothetical protein